MTQWSKLVRRVTSEATNRRFFGREVSNKATENKTEPGIVISRIAGFSSCTLDSRPAVPYAAHHGRQRHF